MSGILILAHLWYLLNMNLFALQVKTRSEELFIKRAVMIRIKDDVGHWRLVFPRKSMTIRKRGAFRQDQQPVFPGYVFLETEDLRGELYWHLRTTAGFFRFLPENSGPQPLEGRDLSMLKHFMSFGDVAGPSRVIFDENDRIKVIEGPLKGLEGRIIKVDKRKCRARVALDLYDESFPVDLTFETLSR